MANSVLKDIVGPDWPLGFISVATPGTPVSIMSLVDATNVNDPSTASGTTSLEYTILAQQIIFQAGRLGASHGTAPSTGNVYLVRYPSRGAGSGNRDDPGCIIWTFPTGQSNLFLSSAPLDRNKYSPYRYYIDADNAGDGVFATLLIS